jgi:hypothetical protein
MIKFVDLKIYIYSDLHVFYFLCSPEYKVFNYDLKVCGIIVGYMQKESGFIFEIRKYDFRSI